MIRRLLLALPLAAASLAAAQTAPPPRFQPDRSGFDVTVRHLSIDYKVFALFALPGASVPIAVENSGAHFSVRATGGRIKALGNNRWRWRAPAAPGHYEVDVRRADGARVRLESFVMVPAGEVRDGRLNGYRIGHYPTLHHAHHAASYAAPRGFVQVTPALRDVPVSPHFTLGQFLCKEAGGYPKYVVLQPRLLLKLEDLMDYLNAHGVQAPKVHVMSGYRTPWYNARLGNVPDSRHTLGDAADIYIDVAPKNGMMDDLNHDGRSDFADSRLLAADINKLFRKPGLNYLRGGVGAYHSTSAHGPFVHVDARGWRARW